MNTNFHVVTILEEDQEIYNTAKINSQINLKRMVKPIISKSNFNEISYWAEPVGIWDKNIIISNKPLEQLSITQDKTDYLWYITYFQSSKKSVLLRITDFQHCIDVFVDKSYQSNFSLYFFYL